MAQKLFVKAMDEEGKTFMKEVHIIRSWQESSGAQIYLHMSGVYGYKDGSPVRDIKEFNIIGDPIQKKAALAWWNRTGKKMADEYYKEQEAIIEERLKRELPKSEGDDSNLDTVQYTRRLLTDRRKNAWSEPSTWFEWFDSRPDWWGHAGLIEIGNHRYKQIDVTEEEFDPDDTEPEEDEKQAEPDTSESGAERETF